MAGLPLELYMMMSLQMQGQQLMQMMTDRDEADTEDLELGDLDEEIDDGLYDDPQIIQQLSSMSRTAAISFLASTVSEIRRSGRYGPRGPYNQIAKCTEYYWTALTWPDREFRHDFRVSRRTFDRLVHELEKNPIFQSTGRKPQRAVRYQLAAFLMRYGDLGSDAMSVAKKLGLGYGTVSLYCRRVTRALREIGLNSATWGSSENNDIAAEAFESRLGLPDCIGILDGSLFRLKEIPGRWGTTYICRKQYPSVNVQAIVDHLKRFKSFEMGWPGSMADVSIWKQSRIYKHRVNYFNGNQYLLADRGYPSSPYLLRPFTEPEVQECQGAEKDRRYKFNRRVSGTRIFVEHAFGNVKARFRALQDIGSHSSIREIYRVIQACMVLHNLCIDLDDHPDDFYSEQTHLHPQEGDGDGDDDVNSLPNYGDIEDSDKDAGVPTYETDSWHKEQGRLKRLAFLDKLFPL